MHRRFFDDDLADFQRIMNVNVLGVMAGTPDAAKHMSTHGGGSIINLSSIGGIQASGGVMTYRASKAAVIHFTKSAAIELAYYDIRVNCIAPGNIPTPLLKSSATNIPAEDVRAFEEKIRADARRPAAPARGDARGHRGGSRLLRRRPLEVCHRHGVAGRRWDKVIPRRPKSAPTPANAAN